MPTVKEYRNKINEFTDEKFGKDFISIDKLDRNEITYVFVIAMKKDGDLSDNLPFFSKISLRQSIRNLERMGFKVQIIRIPFENK